MPLVLSPAYDLDTMNTVVQRCKYIAETNDQKYVVITFDEALYCKLMELKWTNEEYKYFLIPRLGEFHTSLNFMRAIGQHMHSTGLLEVWTESDLLGQKTAESTLLGKVYDKGIHGNKLTFQALWHILLPQMLKHMEEHNNGLWKETTDECQGSTLELIQNLKTKKFTEALQQFVNAQSNDPNLLWWQNMQMVKLLLAFTRAQREGMWELHLAAFRDILPYFFRYDQLNYSKLGGPVCLA